MAEPKLTPGTLYIDRDQDVLSGAWGQYVKIGIVRNDKEAALRNKEHQTGNPRRIHVIHSLESPMVENLETQLHHIFAPQRVLGEWFLLNDQDVSTRVIPEAEMIISSQQANIDLFISKTNMKSLESAGIVREPTPEESRLHSQVVDAKHDLDIKLAKLDVIKGVLIDYAKNSGGIPGILDLQSRIIKAALQKTKLKAEHPDIYQQYETMQLSAPRGAVMIKGVASLKKLDEQLYNDQKQAASSSIFKIKHLDQPLCDHQPAIIDQHNNYLIRLGDIAKAEWLHESLRTKLLVQLGQDEGIEGLISWKRLRKEEWKFDAVKFATHHPKLYETYLEQDKAVIATLISLGRPYKTN